MRGTDAFLRAVVSHREKMLGLVGSAERDDESTIETTRFRVLRAAVGLFAEHGFEGCTMKTLAAAGAVKAPALYNHFASKEQILAEAIALALGDFFRAVLGGLPDVGFESWLELIVRRHATYKLKNMAVYQASDLLLDATRLTPHLPEGDLETVKTVQREYLYLVRDLARGAAAYEMSPNEATVTAFAIIAICDRVSEWYRPAGPLTPDQIADRTWCLAARMLGLV